MTRDHYGALHLAMDDASAKALASAPVPSLTLNAADEAAMKCNRQVLAQDASDRLLEAILASRGSVTKYWADILSPGPTE